MDPENIFFVSSRCLKLVGFQPKENYPKISTAVQLYFIMNLFYFGYSELLFIPRNFHDVMAAAEAFGPAAATILSWWKYFSFFWSKEKFYNLMEKLKDLTAEGTYNGSKIILFKIVPSLNSVESSNIISVKKINRFVRISTLTYLVSSLLAGFPRYFSQIIKNILSFFLKNFEYNYVMAFPSAFYYDINKSPAYELTYFFLFFSTYGVILTGVSLNFLKV